MSLLNHQCQASSAKLEMWARNISFEIF